MAGPPRCLAIRKLAEGQPSLTFALGGIERMSLLVDFKKRGIELPEGCKDLIDVLELATAAAQSQQAPRQARSQGLADIEDYLFRLLASAARFRSVWIDGDPAAVILMFCDTQGFRTMVLVDSGREQAVRSVFADSGISPTKDDALPANGPCSRALVYPLPRAASRAAKIVRDLLTIGLSLSEDVVLEFRYREKNMAQPIAGPNDEGRG